MKQLEVQIMGQSYLLGSPEGGESRLLDAVERVDSAMCRIRDAGKIKARDRIAVLAALNLAFDLADRPPAVVAKTPADTASAPTRAPSGAADTGDDPRLDALLARLDNTLGGDGHLL
jgi:cell division protein ZapA